jgi:hypothetical protein
MKYLLPDVPAAAMSTRRDPAYSRHKVDVANTAFWDGKEYRINHEFTVGATDVVIKFYCPKDFILQLNEFSVDEASVRLRTYRDTQGTEGGTFTPLPVYKVNFMSEAPVVAHTAEVGIGGTFTPDGGEASVETIRIATSASTARVQTITGAVGDERGLPAGTYYVVFDRISSSGTGNVVYSLVWEERE